MKGFFYFSLLFVFFTGCNKKESLEEKKWKEIVKKGDYYFVNGNIDIALEFWIKSLEFKKDSLTYEKIVSSFIAKNQLDEAKKYAISGLTYFPNNDNLLFNLGLIEFYCGEYESSLKVLDKLMERNKYYPEAHYLKGLIYEKKGDFERARKEFIEEININPGSKKTWKKIKEIEK